MLNTESVLQRAAELERLGCARRAYALRLKVATHSDTPEAISAKVWQQIGLDTPLATGDKRRSKRMPADMVARNARIMELIQQGVPRKDIALNLGIELHIVHWVVSRNPQTIK